jgi:hypothetical protein
MGIADLPQGTARTRIKRQGGIEATRQRGGEQAASYERKTAFDEEVEGVRKAMRKKAASGRQHEFDGFVYPLGNMALV